MAVAFVTGANGFIGSNLVRRLLHEGFTVRGLVRPTSDLSFLEGVRLDLRRGTLDDEEVLLAGCRGADVVFHVAGLASDWGPYRRFHRTNVLGTAHMLRAARAARVPRFVHVSSAAVHGFSGYRDLTEEAPLPPSPFPYVETKRRGEALVRAAARRGLPAVIVRPGNVYGPRDRVTSRTLLALLESGWMGVLDGGRRLTCPTYVENLVDALLLAARTGTPPGRAYLVTDGLHITWAEWLAALARALGCRGPRFSLPTPLAARIAAALEAVFLAAGARTPPPLTRYRVGNGGTDYHFSIERACRELRWEPRVGLEAACRATAGWYRACVRPGAVQSGA